MAGVGSGLLEQWVLETEPCGAGIQDGRESRHPHQYRTMMEQWAPAAMRRCCCSRCICSCCCSCSCCEDGMEEESNGGSCDGGGGSGSGGQYHGGRECRSKDRVVNRARGSVSGEHFAWKRTCIVYRDERNSLTTKKL